MMQAMLPTAHRRGSCASVDEVFDGSSSHGGLGMDFETYSGQMVRYYDNLSNAARLTHESRWARHYRREFEKEGNWMREVALALQETVRGRRVLELACGHCRWTPFIAEVAESVLATDLAPNMLQWGRSLLHYAMPEAHNVDFRLANAYRADEIDGEFDAAAVINFFQHVPIAQRDEFLIFLHARLGPGAKVFLAANHIPPEMQRFLFRRDDGTEDTYTRRVRPDGTTYDIIDNVFDGAGLRGLLQSHARGDLQYTSGERYWWVTYTVA
jgi:SAM-dependent methyltransferase